MGTMEKSYLDHLLEDQTNETVLLKPSTDVLDLMTLPERLDDETLDRVRDIARSPLPSLIPCDDRHFNQCLRVMLAVLPKRTSDDISGELFVAAYQRMLGQYPNAAINFLSDKAISRCQWFPTIAECLEILSEWRRKDEFTERQQLARRLVSKETNARDDDRWHWQSPDAGEITQEQIEQMTEPMIKLGLSCGALVHDEDGKVVPWTNPPGEADN